MVFTLKWDNPMQLGTIKPPCLRRPEECETTSQMVQNDLHFLFPAYYLQYSVIVANLIIQIMYTRLGSTKKFLKKVGLNS
ncbi:hypothetical protein CAEBREN_28432 [Caenorhabditis brenneri]|uniref:Uncharacterized protein n=1 Tax=Caenorhabditis brenneri TaxID=135651 RepID=G0MT71_CAEBE|nr:hypothetical protein CAEBREN_28432 [Caenorhabditis brenneri]